VRNDHPAGRSLPFQFVKALDHVLVREAVEAVADDAGFGEPPWNSVGPGNRGHAMVKSGIEAGHLRELGVRPGHAADARDRLRHVLRIDRHQSLERPQKLGRHPSRLPVAAAPVYDAVRHHIG
jgi:hypothetical protein